jgi:uncharacterized membrane protein (DUF106 family)
MLFVLDKIVFSRILRIISKQSSLLNSYNEDQNVMSNYEKQILETEKFYDEAIRAAEAEDIEVLSSVVPGSRLHEIINNPNDSGIDEG